MNADRADFHGFIFIEKIICVNPLNARPVSLAFLCKINFLISGFPRRISEVLLHRF